MVTERRSSLGHSSPCAIAGWGLLCAWLCCGAAMALTVKRPTLAQLTQKSLHIVRATVTSVTADRSAQKLPFTWTQFRVTRVYKGAAISTLKLRLLGGVKGKYRISLAAIPRFRVGEEVVLCVRKYARAPSPVLVALGYGVFDLETTAQGVVVRNRGGLQVPSTWRAFEALLSKTIARQSPYVKSPSRATPARPRARPAPRAQPTRRRPAARSPSPKKKN